MSNEIMLIFAMGMGLTSLWGGFVGAGWCGRADGPCGSSFAVAGEYVYNRAMAVCVVRKVGCQGGARAPRREGPGSACGIPSLVAVAPEEFLLY